MTYKGRGKKTVTGLFGCPGKITRVSDENTKLGRKKLGKGWVFIEFEDESEDWQLLRPTFHRANRAGGWRLIGDDETGLDRDFELDDKDSGDEGDDSESGDSGMSDGDDSESESD